MRAVRVRRRLHRGETSLRFAINAALGLTLVLAAATALPVTAQEKAKAPAEPACPPSGYAQPYYGMVGDNDGVQRGYEIASPCNGKEVRAAALATGMGRWRPLGIKNLSSLRFQATGQFANDAGVLQPVSKLDVGMHFGYPAGRFAVTRGTGRAATTEVKVFNDKLAWNETSPGVGGTPAPETLAQRAPLLKLTPYGALWSVIEAEGRAKVTTEGGKTVITGASPYDGYVVAVTLDEKSLPVAVKMTAEGHEYTATFSGYSTKWESAYLFIFPAKMVWTMDGKPLANLTVTHFHSNPYVVFPPPAALAAK